MKLSLVLSAALFSVILCGCIPIPIPHEGRVSPTFEGTVYDSESGARLSDVKVTLKGFRSDEIIAVTTTDAEGKYKIQKKEMKWIYPLWLGPAEGIKGGTILFAKIRYHPESNQQSRFGGANSFPTFKVDIKLKKTESNQSLQTTTMAVTDAAAQPPRQP